jgi:hypothetical protein
MQTRSSLPRRLLVASLLVLVAPGFAAACSGASQEPALPNPAVPPPTASVAPPPPGLTPTPTASTAATADPGPAAPVSTAAGSGGNAPTSAEDAAKAAACPGDMALVNGDYCTELELKCLSSTYAPQNKKTICHEFQAPSKCVGKKEPRRYCIDKYEYPNKKGERPLVNMNFPQAQKLCAAQGKRMCTETEWTMACEGPEYKPYPYGYIRDPNKCRGDRVYRFPNVKKTFSKNKAEANAELERLWDGVVSGSQPECVSDYGVFDMPGNADELASSETFSSKSEFDNVTTGGPWVSGVRNQCRPKIYTHNEGFAYYYLSFRCCAEADGKPTDPRSPKQIKRGEKWKN